MDKLSSGWSFYSKDSFDLWFLFCLITSFVSVNNQLELVVHKDLYAM